MLGEGVTGVLGVAAMCPTPVVQMVAFKGQRRTTIDPKELVGGEM